MALFTYRNFGGNYIIQFIEIEKMYGKHRAVNNFNLSIDEGEFVCFIGTSGSGKTTSMRMINRMVKPTRGNILIKGKNINTFNEVVLRRSIGYVIQQVGLMPHMSIYDNIVMVPKLLKYSSIEMETIAKDLMKKVNLPLELLDKYPHELSGGMQQRIGVIRALAANQDIILMDEPFGALDPITRNTLQRLVKSLQREMKKTFILVTHDMDEAISLADKIVIMDKGEIVQVGTPEDILMHPINDFVRDLVGEERLNQAMFDYETVERIMREPIKINENQNIKEAANLMFKTKVDDILVVNDDNVLVGRIDMRALTKRDAKHEKVKSILKEVTYILNNTKIRDAIFYVQELGNRNLSVVDAEGHLVGIITRGDIVSNMYDALWLDYAPEDEKELAVDSYFEEFEKVSSAHTVLEDDNDVH